MKWLNNEVLKGEETGKRKEVTAGSVGKMLEGVASGDGKSGKGG